MLTPVRVFVARLRALFGRADEDRDFAEELRSHLEMLTEDHIGRGMPPEEAARQARIRLGAPTSLQARHRDARGFRAIEDWVQDLRFATRLIRRERWLSAAAILAIALGIGANALGFTIINAGFLRGFHFEGAEQLYAISWRPTRGMRLPSAVADLDDWRAARSFSSIAGSTFGPFNISDDVAAPAQTQGARVTANLFEVIQQRPLLGRTFHAEEDRANAPPVVLLSYDLWTSRFSQDAGVVGRSLRINGSPATIIGVMPEGTKFGDNAGAELWIPFIPAEQQLPRDVRLLNVFGRLAPGVSRAQAAAEVEAIAQRIINDYPDQSKNLLGARVETLTERYLNGAAPRMFVVIMGAVIFVLLIACANVANLLLSRAMYRSREVAVRYSLGASRWRIVRQLLIESVVLAGLGGILGLGLAAYGVAAFDAGVHTTGAPYWLRFTIDYRVLAYVSAICIVTGVLFGIAPALQVSREDPQDALKEGARGTAGDRRSSRLGNVMVISELALTVVLLAGAGLMVRSFVALAAAPPGFDLEGLSRMRMQLPPSSYPTPESRRQFFDQLLRKVEATAGVRQAAITTAVPPLDHEERQVILAGSPDMDDQDRPFVSTVSASAQYFDTLGIDVIRGRGFEIGDGDPGSANIVINQKMAARFFPNGDPIGQKLRFVARLDSAGAAPQPWYTIVGVVPTIQQGSEDDVFRSAAAYLPFMNRPDSDASLLVRSSLPPASVMAAVRDILRTIDPDQPVFNIETLQHTFANERSIFGIFATLFGVLASIGLVLSAIGIYGVIAYAVTQRTQEIGLRVAIGATRQDVVWLFLRKGLLQLGIALLVGLPAAIGLGEVARFQLVEVAPTDLVTLISITVLLAVVALVACAVPSFKAARVEPLTALRSE